MRFSYTYVCRVCFHMLSWCGASEPRCDLPRKKSGFDERQPCGGEMRKL
jgi:hypothetical protein